MESITLTECDLNKWIAIVDNHVIAKGDDLDKVYRRAKEKSPHDEPTLDIFQGNIAMVV